MSDWSKVTRKPAVSPRHERRNTPCVSRSPKRPGMAYMMLPRSMVPKDRVSIYADKRGRIGFEFSDGGEYTVRPTSATSFTMKITIPSALADRIPFGLHDVVLDRNADGWLIFDPQTVA